MASDDPDFQSAFWETKHAMALVSAAAFSRHGVHEGQQYVLMTLWEEDGLTPGEIAKRLGLATPTVTRATTRMEAVGLLRREPHPTDGRLVQLRLTTKGRKLERAIRAEMDRVNDRALAGFSSTERAALVKALQRVRNNLGG